MLNLSSKGIACQMDRPGRGSSIITAINVNAGYGGRRGLCVQAEYLLLCPVIVDVQLAIYCYDLVP